MSGWSWLAIALIVIGLTLLVIGFMQMTKAKPDASLKGGFGGPAGSSDVGGHDGFHAPDPNAYVKVGAPLRIAGFVAVIAGALIGLVLTILHFT